MKCDPGRGGWLSSAWRVARRLRRPAIAAAAAILAAALAGCMAENPTPLATAQPRGATVAFESIDGPPREQFGTLVRNLNEEAQSRRLAVVSRDGTAAYRVRGYLSVKVGGDKTTVSWLWDVFDGNAQRALRIGGEEIAAGPRAAPAGDHADAWKALDDGMLRRIASSSMDRLAAFLTSPDVVPEASATVTPAALVADAGSPEAAGIFRIYRANADPAQVGDKPDTDAAAPLPPSRPDAAPALAPAPARWASSL